MSRWLYYLLVMAVVAPAIDLIWGQQQALAIFICATIALLPLAALIGQSTEALEHFVGPIAGGLLNASAGNVPELIIGFFALRDGLISVVQASLTGSIISNALLVLGSSLALGGWRWGKQFFNARDAGQYAAMLVLAVAGLVIASTGSLALQDSTHDQFVSVAIAIVLLTVYALYIAWHVFHIRSKRRNLSRRAPPSEDDALEDQDEEPVAEHSLKGQSRNIWITLAVLLATTFATAWNSELLVSTIKPVTEQLGWSPVFVGLVIIPIVGNAAEHSSSVYIALRDRVDLSMAIAAGSSIQVATFVTPLLVIISMFFPQHMTLIFQPLELAILGVATVLFSFVSHDGESSWLAGVQLIAIYLMACVVFFFIPGAS